MKRRKKKCNHIKNWNYYLCFVFPQAFKTLKFSSIFSSIRECRILESIFRWHFRIYYGGSQTQITIIWVHCLPFHQRSGPMIGWAAHLEKRFRAENFGIRPNFKLMTHFQNKNKRLAVRNIVHAKSEEDDGNFKCQMVFFSPFYFPRTEVRNECIILTFRYTNARNELNFFPNSVFFFFFFNKRTLTKRSYQLTFFLADPLPQFTFK